MTVATQIEVLDLRHFSARQLRPLLEAEARLWENRLRWDYRSSTELLLQYLDSRILPGFVALDHGRICGYTFCVYEGQKAVVGDAYAVTKDGASNLAVTQLLLRHLLELVENSPNVDRVESQLLLYDTGALEEAFLEAGFMQHLRLFMECDLAQRPAAVELKELPPGLEVVSWSSSYYQAAAELIHDAYAGHIDARINDQYCSLHGSLRFLHNIVRFPGCGVFDPNQSWLLVDRNRNMLAGMLLCSRVAPDVAHITQLCVRSTARGLGLGQMLLAHSMTQLDRAGFAAITLTVTESNRPAVTLYEASGFHVRYRFDAMVLDRSTKPR
ncbi:MAG: GNAT family N-acetyltransferase [Edaphobacter sp.]|uniref:GNAT family N-acetyltransferase n=1 Tax=Edaphobacter sp. TaxID=1934404 RepID=UPI002396609C|nr:GNAT family N-acetyltransferase [Edaphobacter sp.]MDE1177319.1 GNAT family N-acetyltransferase [Edaphobacter sp.]